MRFWRSNWQTLSRRLAVRRAAALKRLLARQKEEVELLERHGLCDAATYVRKEISEVEDLLRMGRPPADNPERIEPRQTV